MSLTVTPLKGRTSRSGALVLVWDGNGKSKVSISDIAVLTCQSPKAVFTSLIELKVNAAAAHYVLDQVDPLIIATKKAFVADFEEYFGDLLDVEDNEELTPSEMWTNVDTAALTVALADTLKFRVPDLRVDFAEVGSVTVKRRIDQTQFDTCRERQSLIVARQKEVLEYEERVMRAKNALTELEKAIKRYEKGAQKWIEAPTGGAPIVEMAYMLGLIENVADVYMDADPNARFTNNLARDMGELVTQAMEKQRRKALASRLDKLVELYSAPKILGPLAEYVAHWDPSDRFHFYDVADAATGMPNFGDRVFHAMQKVATYAVEKEDFAAEAAEEIKRLHGRLEEIDNDGATPRIAASRKKVHGAIKSALGGGGGLMTILAIWNGYVANLVGNFEGPPSVAALILNSWTSNINFFSGIQEALTTKGHKSTLLLLGITEAERVALLRLINEGANGRVKALHQAQELFKSANWRGTSVFAVFSAFQMWTLLTHVNDLVKKGDKDAPAEITKAIITVLQDVGGLYLTGVTIWHDGYVNNFLRSVGRNLTGRKMEAFFDKASNASPMRVARMVHRSLAFLAVTMAGWDLYETRGNRDAFESMFKLTALGAAGLSLVGAIGSAGPLAALGPWGFLIGFAASVGGTIYDSLIKSDLKKMMQSIMAQVTASKFHKLHGRGLELRAPEAMDPQICDGVCYFVSADDPMLPWSTLVTTLQADINDYGWSQKMRASSITRLYRAGLKPGTIAKIMDRDEEDVRGAIKKGMAGAKSFSVDHSLKLVPAIPDSPEEIVWEPGVPVEITLTLSGRHAGRGPRFIYLEYNGDDLAEDVLTPADGSKPFNSYDADRDAVVLAGYKTAGFKHGKLSADLYRYRGHIYFRHAPTDTPIETVAGERVRRANFTVCVPDENSDVDDLSGGDRPPNVLDRDLSLPVRA